MAWNGPIDGDWSTVNFNAAPWDNGIMTLTNEEVIYVQTETQRIREELTVTLGHTPDDNLHVVPTYNEQDWHYCVNGNTYAVIKQYDTTIHTLGIDGNGIVLPVEEVPEEQPIEEVPTEGV